MLSFFSLVSLKVVAKIAFEKNIIRSHISDAEMKTLKKKGQFKVVARASGDDKK